MIIKPGTIKFAWGGGREKESYRTNMLTLPYAALLHAESNTSFR